jgi:AcrR family transcriptional regulator
VNAAREVFVTQGYVEATATTITTAAGVSYGSFYVYFESKEELFLEVATELMDEVYLASRAPRDQVDAAQRLAYENRRYFELYRENASLFHLIEEAISTDSGFRAHWLVMHRKYIQRIAKGLRRLQRDGRMDPDLDARYTAESLGAMAERLAYLSTVDPTFDIEKALKTLSSLWGLTLGLDVPATVSRSA